MLELNKREINKMKELLGIKEHQGERLVKALNKATNPKGKRKY